MKSLLACVLMSLCVALSSQSEAPPDGNVNFPLFKWAQDRSRIWITVHVAAVKDEKVEITESSVKFEGVGGNDHKPYRLDLDLHSTVNTQRSTHKRLDKNYQFVLHKQKTGPHWPHLLRTTKKLEEGNMRIDWTRWTVEEAETTEEERQEAKLKADDVQAAEQQPQTEEQQQQPTEDQPTEAQQATDQAQEQQPQEQVQASEQLKEEL